MTTDWPVARIPSDPIANHTTGERMPLRWPQHGDLRILVDGPDVFVVAEDLHALAGYDGDAVPHPAIVPAVTWSRRSGAELVAHYTLAEAVAVLEYSPTHLTGELLEWMRVQIPAALRPEVLDNLTGLESFMTSFTVRQAAGILDRDPAVSIGRQSLFRHLELIGWIERDLTGVWRPLSAAIRGHWLTVREVSVRAGKSVTPYSQLYVTQAGLVELRRSLRALHLDAPAVVPAPEQLPLN